MPLKSARHRIGVPAALGMLGVAVLAAPAAHGYTVDQAVAGRAVFEQRCVGCHGANLQGGIGPALVGQTNIGNLGTAQALFDYIRVAMPLEAPGSLTDDEYWNVAAFLLSQNGLPPDGQSLGPETAPAVPIITGGEPADLSQPAEAPAAEEPVAGTEAD